MSSKSVSFHKKLHQDSAVHKSRPRELLAVIKIGAIFYPVMRNSCNVFGKASVSSDAPIEHAFFSYFSTARLTDVPIQELFQNLKRDLHVNLNLDHVANTQPSARFIDRPPPQGERFSFLSSHATRLCFRCLSPAHLVKDCSWQIRCWFCFSYGHRANSCFKRLSGTSVKRVPKLKQQDRLRNEDNQSVNNSNPHYFEGTTSSSEPESFQNTTQLSWSATKSGT
jgi:hypothetical protein